ncbi:MAG: Glycogen phosphorylase, partial [candidate division CPR2 bacterium GW2011_GWD1_39_7]
MCKYAPKDSFNKEDVTIAYFSMEIGLTSKMTNYSGGLGILAGDTIKACADLNIPMVAVTLLNKDGYFKQVIDKDGNQIEEADPWEPHGYTTLCPEIVSIWIQDREVKVRAFKREVKGVGGYTLPVYFLDTDFDHNEEWCQSLTKHLYGGDESYRLAQEIILGIGGFRMLQALGYTVINKYHLNEGHASFLILELLSKTALETEFGWQYKSELVKKMCVFTTHTPVAAGHDRFSFDKVKSFMGAYYPYHMVEAAVADGNLNVTKMALMYSGYVNGVAKKHGEVSRDMFGDSEIDHITNGVHSVTWTSKPFKKVFDKYIPGWREDPFTLRSAWGIPSDEVWDAHLEAKRKLIEIINEKTNENFEENVFTIGFARRFTQYKRPMFIFKNEAALRNIISRSGKIQIVFAGKAHPKDFEGKGILKEVIEKVKDPNLKIKVAFLENYNMELAGYLTSGVDIWLNNPQRPMEASGTSGMKAAHNGIPSLSILDGWWIEGHIEGVTGWAIGEENYRCSGETAEQRELDDFYKKYPGWDVFPVIGSYQFVGCPAEPF